MKLFRTLLTVIPATLAAFWGTLLNAQTAAPSTAPPAGSRRPNIVYVMADDLGWTDVACYGSTFYESPNIDRLASQGMKFTNACTAAPNCAPTRAALMSGQYQPRTGIYTVGSIDRFPWETRPLRPVDNVESLPLDKTTVAKALKNAGYATGMFGKWHLGNGAEFHPGKRGFDEALVTSGKHFDFETTPKFDYPKGQYLADFLTDRAVDFITRHKDEPFFLYIPHFGVHAPHDAKPELIGKFKDKDRTGGHHSPPYAAMIYSVDESVGRIMKTLDDLGLSENTLLVFTSDNGGVGGYEKAGVPIKGVTDNAPLRGGKGMLYEGGVRVPYIARWPRHIKAGVVTDVPIVSVDMYPTFLDLTQSPAPKDYTLDGESLLPVLTGAAPALKRDAIYWHFPGYLGGPNNSWRTTPGGAIRMGDMKLLQYFEDHHVELYNLKDDIGQQHDLAKEKPDVAKAMTDKLHAWQKETGAKMPTENKERTDKPTRKRKGGGNDE